ncbi:MAG: ribosome maturation factor RimP [Candidatus Omnitrophica bacterium]|nr:ribosome maturation factor RimP [Candidatus Omnitrophota bacterium]
MIKEELVKELNELIGSCLSRQGLELIDLICRHDGNNLVLRILADRPTGGITLGECALLNRQLSQLLEEKNIIDSNYVLEVSSPGLDRCLKTQKDFSRCLNKEAVFFLNDLVGGKCQWQGLITRADDKSVFIDHSGQVLEIPLIKINKARLVV